MTTEAVLLLVLMLIILSAVIGETGPRKIFETVGPRLGARLERQLTTGSSFTDASSKAGYSWSDPAAAGAKKPGSSFR